MLCIYLKPSHKIGPRRFWGARPLYRKLIRTAKADGIINASRSTGVDVAASIVLCLFAVWLGSTASNLFRS